MEIVSNFAIVKEKIIKVDSLINICQQLTKKNKLVKEKLEESSVKLKRFEIENDRLSFQLEKANQTNEKLEKENKDYMVQMSDLEGTYNKQVVESMATIRNLEHELRMIQEMRMAVSPKAERKNQKTPKEIKAVNSKCNCKELIEDVNKEVNSLKISLDQKIKENENITNINIQQIQRIEYLEKRLSMIEMENENLKMIVKNNAKRKVNAKVQTVHYESEDDLISSSFIQHILTEMKECPPALSPLASDIYLDEISDATLNVNSAVPDNIPIVNSPDVLSDVLPPISDNIHVQHMPRDTPINETESDREFETKQPKVLSKIIRTRKINVRKQRLRSRYSDGVKYNKTARRQLMLQRMKNRKSNEDVILRALKTLQDNKINFTISNESLLARDKVPPQVSPLVDVQTPVPKTNADNLFVSKVDPETTVSKLMRFSKECDKYQMVLNSDSQLVGFCDTTPKSNLNNSTTRCKPEETFLNQQDIEKDLLNKLTTLVSKKLQRGHLKRKIKRNYSVYSESEPEISRLFCESDDNFETNNKLMGKIRSEPDCSSGFCSNDDRDKMTTPGSDYSSRSFKTPFVNLKEFTIPLENVGARYYSKSDCNVGLGCNLQTSFCSDRDSVCRSEAATPTLPNDFMEYFKPPVMLSPVGSLKLSKKVCGEGNLNVEGVNEINRVKKNLTNLTESSLKCSKEFGFQKVDETKDEIGNKRKTARQKLVKTQNKIGKLEEIESNALNEDELSSFEKQMNALEGTVNSAENTSLESTKKFDTPTPGHVEQNNVNKNVEDESFRKSVWVDDLESPLSPDFEEILDLAAKIIPTENTEKCRIEGFNDTLVNTEHLETLNTANNKEESIKNVEEDSTIKRKFECTTFASSNKKIKATSLQKTVMKQIREKQAMLNFAATKPFYGENPKTPVTVNDKIKNVSQTKIVEKSCHNLGSKNSVTVNSNQCTQSKINVLQNVVLMKPGNANEISPIKSTKARRMEHCNVNLEKPSASNTCDLLSKIMSEMDSKIPPPPTNHKKTDNPLSLEDKAWKLKLLEVAEILHNKDDLVEDLNPYWYKRSSGVVKWSLRPFSDKARNLFHRLLENCETLPIPNGLILEFSSFHQNCIIDMILHKLLNDFRDKPNSRHYPAPPMTKTQYRLLDFMVQLQNERSEQILDTFLHKIDTELFDKGCGFRSIQPVTRLYTAVCKLTGNIKMIRVFICKAFLLLQFVSIPLLFTVLTCWPEVFPKKSDWKNFPPSKVIVNAVHAINLKNVKGYNLIPLKILLEQYYGYPREQDDSEILFEQFYKEYIGKPTPSGDYCLRVFFKYQPVQFLCKKVDQVFKPLVYKIPDCNVNLKATVIILIGKLCFKPARMGQFSVTFFNELHMFFKGLLEDSASDLIKKAVCICLESILPTGPTKNGAKKAKKRKRGKQKKGLDGNKMKETRDYNLIINKKDIL